jgi:hypothetical protein
MLETHASRPNTLPSVWRHVVPCITLAMAALFPTSGCEEKPLGRSCTLARCRAAGTLQVASSGTTAYLIDGAANPNLTLCRGATYSFRVNAQGHPFYIKTAKGTGTDNEYSDGVSGNGTDMGTVTFQVPSGAPATLFYCSSADDAMTGTIRLVEPGPIQPAEGAYSLNSAECQTQMCVKPAVQQGVSQDLDTAPYCSMRCQVDSDCQGQLREPGNPGDKRCTRGYTCAKTFGPSDNVEGGGDLCCRKICLCKDFYLQSQEPALPDGCQSGSDETCPAARRY